MYSIVTNSTTCIKVAVCALILLASVNLPSSVEAHPYYLSSDGFLIKDGRKILPLGIYSVPNSAIAEVSSAGFDTAANPFWTASDTSASSFLDTALAQNMHGVVGFDEPRVLSNTTRYNYLRGFMEAVGRKSNNIAYYLPDEAISRGVSASMLNAIRSSVKSIEPSALIMYDDYSITAATAAKSSYDIFSYDEYPIGTTSIQTYRGLLRQVIAAAKPKPVWLSLQAYVNPPQWIEPTRSELRSMAYLGLANGVRGLLWYQHCESWCSSHIRNYPTLWTNLKNLVAELKSISGVLTMPDSNEITASTSVAGLDLKVKSGNGKYYLIAANWKSGAKQSDGHYTGQSLSSVPITLTGLSRGIVKTVATTTSPSSKKLSRGKFSDSFQAYDAKVYEITPYH